MQAEMALSFLQGLERGAIERGDHGLRLCADNAREAVTELLLLVGVENGVCDPTEEMIEVGRAAYHKTARETGCVDFSGARIASAYRAMRLAAVKGDASR